MTPYSIAPLARADLDDIWEYVAADNPPAADRLVEVFFDKFLLLAKQPLLGESRSDLAPDLRSFSAGKYVIYYRPSPGRVRIVRVLQGARDVRALFGGECQDP